MTTKRISGLGPSVRRNAVWPWLVMPMIILALFYVLHKVREYGPTNGQSSSFGSGMP
jgi:hypothetical protein